MNINLFFGEDGYSVRKKVALWKAHFIEKYDDTNIETIEGKKITGSEFASLTTTLPFLAEKRLVLIRNFLADGNKDEQKKIGVELEHVADFCIVLFIEDRDFDKRSSLYKKLQKNAEVEEFKHIQGSKLFAWIDKECAKLETTIDQQAKILLGDITGGDLQRLENELCKLSNYVRDKERAISREDVGLLVNMQLETSIFKLTDALATKNTRESLKLLHQSLDAGEDLHRILFMIIRQFRIIIQVRDMRDKGSDKNSIARETGEKPFVVGIAMSQASNFSMEKLRKIYDHLLEMDIALKSGGIKILKGDQREFQLAVDTFIVEACA